MSPQMDAGNSNNRKKMATIQKC